MKTTTQKTGRARLAARLRYPLCHRRRTTTRTRPSRRVEPTLRRRPFYFSVLVGRAAVLSLANKAVFFGKPGRVREALAIKAPTLQGGETGKYCRRSRSAWVCRIFDLGWLCLGGRPRWRQRRCRGQLSALAVLRGGRAMIGLVLPPEERYVTSGAWRQEVGLGLSAHKCHPGDAPLPIPGLLA